MRHTHKDQVSQAWGLRLTLPMSGHNLLCGLPLFHVGGALTPGLAAAVGQPEAYAGEPPVAHVQAKPGAAVYADELLDFVRKRTPERAVVPVKLHLIDAIPATGVGKIFKPALRIDAAERMVRALRAHLNAGAARLTVAVQAHPEHGQIIRVGAEGATGAAREAVKQQVREGGWGRCRCAMNPSGSEAPGPVPPPCARPPTGRSGSSVCGRRCTEPVTPVPIFRQAPSGRQVFPQTQAPAQMPDPVVVGQSIAGAQVGA